MRLQYLRDILSKKCRLLQDRWIKPIATWEDNNTIMATTWTHPGATMMHTIRNALHTKLITKVVIYTAARPSEVVIGTGQTNQVVLQDGCKGPL